FCDDLVLKIERAFCVDRYRNRGSVHAGHFHVVGRQLDFDSRRINEIAQHDEDEEQEEDGDKRRRIELAGKDAGVTRKLHGALGGRLSATTCTTSVAARSMSRTMELTRLTR